MSQPHLGSVKFNDAATRDWLAQTRRERDDLRLGARPLILLGAGSVLSRDFVTAMLARGQVVALVDNARAGTSEDGVPVIGDSDVAAIVARHPDAIGVMCCGSENAIAHFNRVWTKTDRPLLTYFAVLAALPGLVPAGSPLRLIDAFTDEARIFAEHAAVSDVFSDADSRRTLDALMLYRLTWDQAWLDAVRMPENSIYFAEGLLPIGDDEVLVDGGAYDGDTARAFAARTGGRYRHIHAFELDPDNARRFAEKSGGMPNVTLHACGLWDGPARVNLKGEIDLGRRIDSSLPGEHRLEALDDLDIGPVTLIKLDIEGAEANALRGAQKTIMRYRPNMAICAYHKPDDLSVLTAALRDLPGDYRLKLRHHSPILFDSVIYAL
ncbi:MAG: FkbM family methyltransferase [Asticcacaulis sp.]|uniref:FkbM family methyltransferase n=1 Tax=Asticcacaulis sp. TaxID=1872648 RepID=UPI003F7B946D